LLDIAYLREAMSVIPSLGSVILPGDFIVFKSGEGVEVCQLKRFLSSLLVEVVVWIEAVDAPPSMFSYL
jgi:hypothetical protein